jgi:hypothetical protein
MSVWDLIVANEFLLETSKTDICPMIALKIF